MTKQWEDVREAVLYLYKQQNQPLHVVKATMEQKYRFKASYVHCLTPSSLVCFTFSSRAVSRINPYIPGPKPEEERNWLWERSREPREFCGEQGSFQPAEPHCPF